jgi:hypothetical protein
MQVSRKEEENEQSRKWQQMWVCHKATVEENFLSSMVGSNQVADFWWNVIPKSCSNHSKGGSEQFNHGDCAGAASWDLAINLFLFIPFTQFAWKEGGMIRNDR